MIITVTRKGFAWKPSKKKRRIALKLTAPYYCHHESISVYRKGRRITLGYIQWIGTHGAYPAFQNMSPILGKDGFAFSTRLFPKMFRIGDEIRIFDSSGRELTDPAFYWDEMTASS
jgi:hypothetical protein